MGGRTRRDLNADVRMGGRTHRDWNAHSTVIHALRRVSVLHVIALLALSVQNMTHAHYASQLEGYIVNKFSDDHPCTYQAPPLSPTGVVGRNIDI